MTGCKECGGALGPRNKSGYCRKHAFLAARQNPQFAERQLAGIRRKIAHDPEYKDKLRSRARALSADPEIAHRRSRAFVENRTWELGNLASRSPEVRAKARRSVIETRVGWCPPHLRADYRSLVYTHHFRAAEARKMIEEQNELEMARWRRSIGVVEQPIVEELAPALKPEVVRIPLDAALNLAAKRFCTTVSDILSDSRFATHVRPRYALACAMRRTGMSYPAIASALNRTDHSSSMHWVAQGQALMKSDRKFARQVAEIEACWSALEKAA
jgi:hypothetical protein